MADETQASPSSPVQSEHVHVAMPETACEAVASVASPAGTSQHFARRRASFFPIARAGASSDSTATATGATASSTDGGASLVSTNADKPPLKILIASWNVGNAMPPKDPQKIHEWIPEGGGDFDVIAIGLQESSYREKAASVSAGIAPGDGAATGASGSLPGTLGDGADLDGCDNGSPTRRDTSRTDWDSENEECYADDDDVPEDEELAAALAEARRIAREDSLHTSPQSSPRKGSLQLDMDGQDGQSAADQETQDTGAPATAAGGGSSRSLGTGEVIIKRSRTKKSIRTVSKIVRQVSTNLRDSVAEALDYPFNRQLYGHLGESYNLVGKVELMEMRLFVYVHARHAVSGIEKISVPTGLGSVLGNKGGLVFKCVIQDTSLCFVSCHLAAHQDQKFLDKRNSDCASILGASFGMKKVALDHQFDHCFWFGDLNYRVDLNYAKTKDRTSEQHFAEVLAHVRAKKWDVLNANDQLKFQVEGKKALAGWELPPALFPPTFKRIRHAPDEYNPQRIPSFCDRVLHKSLPGRRANLKLQRFACVESISSSDHKPVLAEYLVRTTLPIVVDPSLSATESTLVEITDLAAKDLLGMDMTGLSDPYIKFYSIPSNALQVESSGSHPSTTTIMSTLSPAWRDDQVPKLRVSCTDEKDVRLVHLVLLLMDYDTTSTDDVLGVATISLDRYCLAKPRFLPFEAPVTCNGKAAGSVSGKLRVALPHQVADLANLSTRALQHGPMATCYCSVS